MIASSSPRADTPAEDAASQGALQARIAQVHHDIKNPLSVIAGNAQFLLELSQVLELDPQVVTSIEDIEEAVHDVEACLNALVTLKKEL